MKKYYFLLLLTVIGVYSCEKDDFCIDPITPNLVVRFYDASSTSEIKAVDDLTVWPEGRDSLYVNSATDSIVIPLDVTNAQTIYNFQSGTLIDQITIDYTVNEVFVSRSCGFKATFTDLATTPTNNWIQSIQVISTTIEDESAAHIQIFH